MKLGEFLECLEGRDPEMEVVVRASGDGIEDGDYLDVRTGMNITVEYGKVVIIGDLPDDDEEDEEE